MKSPTAIGIVPAVGLSLLPTLTCPACLPALASILGAVGLTFIAEPRYLFCLNLAAFVIAWLLLARNECHWRSLPLGGAAIGAVAVMLGKFLWKSSFLWWIGLGVFMAGSVWSGLRRTSQQMCVNCETQIMED